MVALICHSPTIDLAIKPRCVPVLLYFIHLKRARQKQRHPYLSSTSRHTSPVVESGKRRHKQGTCRAYLGRLGRKP
jgi:hypothetical protein